MADNMQLAVNAVKNGMSVEAAALKYHVNYNDLLKQFTAKDQANLTNAIAGTNQEDPVDGFHNSTNSQNTQNDIPQESDNNTIWKIGTGSVLAIVGMLAIHNVKNSKNIIQKGKEFFKLSKNIDKNIKNMEKLNAKQLEDGRYYAQAIIKM